MIKQNGNNIKVTPVNIFSYYKPDKLILDTVINNHLKYL